MVQGVFIQKGYRAIAHGCPLHMIRLPTFVHFAFLIEPRHQASQTADHARTTTSKMFCLGYVLGRRKAGDNAETSSARRAGASPCRQVKAPACSQCWASAQCQARCGFNPQIERVETALCPLFLPHACLLTMMPSRDPSRDWPKLVL